MSELFIIMLSLYIYYKSAKNLISRRVRCIYIDLVGNINCIFIEAQRL